MEATEGSYCVFRSAYQELEDTPHEIRRVPHCSENHTLKDVLAHSTASTYADGDWPLCSRN